MGIGPALGLIGALKAKAEKDIKQVKNKIAQFPTTATVGDVGKVLKLKTVENGKPAEYEYGVVDSSVVKQSVKDVLEEHPEWTTTVEDGSITEEKLATDVKGQLDELDGNALVKVDTEKSGYHNVAPISVTFYPNDDLTTVSAKYSEGKSIIDGLFSTSKQNGISRSISGRLIYLSGTGTGQLFLIDAKPDMVSAIKGKTFYAYMYIKKSTNWEIGSWIGFYDGKSYRGRKYFTANSNDLFGWTAIGSITFASDADNFLLKFDSLNGAVFAEGDFIWVGLYESQLVDTEHILDDENTYTLSVSGLTSIDTAMHESTAKYVKNTKEYVDDRTPNIKEYWSEEVYALPEKFGAAGDGTTDDSTAIASCIEYAKTNGKAIRGFNSYKVSNTIVLDERYLDIYLKEIKYTGNGAAVEIKNRDIVFEFHRIQSNNIGLSFSHLQDNSKSAMSCQVKGNEISSESHCIEVKNLTFYNTCDIRWLNSNNGDCIKRNNEGTQSSAGEYVFRSSTCRCPNGWVSNGVVSSKFYDFTIEGNCKYGLLNPFACVCFGFRHREQIDRLRMRLMYGDEYDNGPLIKFTEMPIKGRFKYITDDPVFYCSIDVSEIDGYETTSVFDDWQELTSYCIDMGIVVNSMEQQNSKIMGTKSYIIGGNLVLAPEYRITSIVDIATLDFSAFDGRQDQDIIDSYSLAKYLGTDYSLDVSHADIYFNSYFGAIGYNELTITQSNGNTATIYDKLGNVIFDGTNEGNGKWRLQCVVDRSSFGRYTGPTSGTVAGWWGYDGTNEEWIVEKIE